MASSSGDLQLSQRPTAVKHKGAGRRISALNSEATVLNRGEKRTDCPRKWESRAGVAKREGEAFDFLTELNSLHRLWGRTVCSRQKNTIPGTSGKK